MTHAPRYDSLSLDVKTSAYGLLRGEEEGVASVDTGNVPDTAARVFISKTFGLFKNGYFFKAIP
jgi:hypothetical protein